MQTTLLIILYGVYVELLQACHVTSGHSYFHGDMSAFSPGISQGPVAMLARLNRSVMTPHFLGYMSVGGKQTEALLHFSNSKQFI